MIISESLNVDWTNCFCNNDVNACWSSFKSNFLEVLDKVAPFKEIRLKIKSQPWITSDILDNIQQRDKLLQKFKKSKDKDHYKQYCQMRNKVQRAVKMTSKPS